MATALVCCAIPAWKAQSLDRLRPRSTVQFVSKQSSKYSTSGAVLFILTWARKHRRPLPRRCWKVPETFRKYVMLRSLFHENFQDYHEYYNPTYWIRFLRLLRGLLRWWSQAPPSATSADPVGMVSPTASSPYVKSGKFVKWASLSGSRRRLC